ncbi:S8 family serine peptidase, partial [Pradoshia sp.]
SGVAPNAKLMPINVFNRGMAYTSEIIHGIEYAVKNGADVINLSLGMEMYSRALNEAVQTAYKKGVLIIAAAGNSGTYTTHYPAGYKNVLSVGATTQYDVLARYSNFGRTVDILAPGTAILSTLPNGKYGAYSGTSMASPIVAGVAALIWSKEPKLTNEQVAYRLLQTAQPLKNPRTQKFYDYPRVNAANALKYRMLASPKVPDITDKQTKVSVGYSSGFKGKIYVTAKGKTITKDANYSSAYSVAFDIGKMAAGSKVSVKLVDREGNESWPVMKTVKDATPPNAPKVQVVADHSKTISGTAEEGAAISVKNGKTTVTSGKADKSGKFNLKLKSKLKAGTTLMVTATDHAKNVSKAAKVIVKDKTPPALTQMSKITSSTTKVTGKTEARASVILETGKKQLAKPVKADKNGKFTISMKKQKAGTIIKVILVDEAGNKSKAYEKKVLKK